MLQVVIFFKTGPNTGSGRYSNWLILNTKFQGGFGIRKLR